MEHISIFDETVNWCKKNNILYRAERTTTSTNDLAKDEAFKLKDNFKLYIADQQTLGRGRSTNLWHNTSPGHSLMCSWSYLCKMNPQAITGPTVGLALYTSLSKIFSLKELSIKPPNDIYLVDKKILGILVETISSIEVSRLIIGFGLNVFSHPSDLRAAGHLSEKTKITVENWHHWLSQANDNLLEASRSVQATHLTVVQRQNLLTAMNANPLLDSPYQSVSPFGDLAKNDKTISWRDL